MQWLKRIHLAETTEETDKPQSRQFEKQVCLQASETPWQRTTGLQVQAVRQTRLRAVAKTSCRHS